MLQHEDARIGEIVHKEELAPWRSGTPDGHTRGTRLLRFMETSDKCSDNMTIFGVIVVAWTVEIRRHDRNEVGAILAPIGLTEFDPSDLGDRVRLIRRLEWASKQFVLGHWLARQLWIDA